LKIGIIGFLELSDNNKERVISPKYWELNSGQKWSNKKCWCWKILNHASKMQ
jgi:hypothetical protein